MAFFKSLFGPKREEIWKQLQAEIGAELVPGCFWTGAKLQAQVNEWTVTLDEYAQMMMVGRTPIYLHHTRMRAPFPNPSGFRLSLYRASVFSALAAFLGMQDIQVGYPEFDDDFVIKGNNEAAVRSLCSSERLRALVMAQPKFSLTIRDDEGWFGTEYPPHVDVLVFDVVDRIREVERLKGLYDVFAETLERLSEMGVAGSGTGGVSI